MSMVPTGDLVSTLNLALTQCQEQTETIQSHVAHISRLQLENEHLRNEVRKLTNKSATTRVVTPPPNTQVPELERLIQRDAEAQAEIAHLKKKVRSYKEKLQRRSENSASSTFTLISTPQHSSQSISPKPEVDASGQALTTTASTRPQKRPRLDGSHALQVSSAEMSDNQLSRNARHDPERRKEHGEAAISFLSEDREVFAQDSERTRTNGPQTRTNESRRKPLESLLNAPTPHKSSLKRPAALAYSSISDIECKPDIQHPPRGLSKNLALDAEAFDTNRSYSAACQLSSGDPEDEEPLCARPLHRLSLRHFRLSKKWLDSEGISYEDFLKGKNGERIRLLAETLPAKATDHDLLLDYLGPGSEDQISSLTSVARKNLVAEAKLARVAKSFGRVRRDYDRDEDPPGFWQPDFPGTQEEQDNREKARRLEREEVKKRYDDALKGNGRWIFADEVG